MLIQTKPCPGCGEVAEFSVDDVDYGMWLGNELHAQDAFPHLTDGERERLITGICDPCWELMMPPEEDEDWSEGELADDGPLSMSDDPTYDSDWYVEG